MYGVVSHHLHYVASKVIDMSPGDSWFYPHVADPEPVAVVPPKARVIEPA
jgi:hypothetical protein